MHEISLVRNIFRTLQETMPAADLDRVSTIRLKVGKLANVEPILMQNAFEAVVETDEPRYRQTRLEIEVVPIKVSCNHCGEVTLVENYRFVCGQCGQPTNHILSGEELLISGVELTD